MSRGIDEFDDFPCHECGSYDCDGDCIYDCGVCGEDPCICDEVLNG